MEKKQLKVQGLRFVRALQNAVRMASLYSVDHRSATLPIQTSYALLIAVVKQTSYLTVGFVEQRVIVNNILTTDTSLNRMEDEFLKRGIGAITFDAGITLAAYKNAVEVLAASQKTFDAHGGLMPFLETRQLDCVRVFPAGKNEARNRDGDTVLDVSSEEYLISKALAGANTGVSQSFDALLSQIQPEADGTGLGGTGFGGPDAGSGPGGPGGFGGAGSVSGGSWSGTSIPGTPAPGRSWAANGLPGDLQSLVEKRLESSFNDLDEDPQRTYAEMARLIKEIRLDALLAGGRTGEGKPEDLTAEVFENAALSWAVHRLSSTPSGEKAVLVEDHVFRVLMRSLQTTKAATRMAAKLSELAKEHSMPEQTYNRIHDELRWAGLNLKQKLRDLLGISHFTRIEFVRALALIKDLIRHNKPEDATALGLQYLSIFEDHGGIKIEEIGRLPELVRALTGVPGEFRPAAAQLLTKALASDRLDQGAMHLQVVNVLAALAQTAGRCEDFDLAYQVGAAMEQHGSSGPEHMNCCSAALSTLLPPPVADRVAETFLRKKDSSSWIRIGAALLRWSGPDGVERLFSLLEGERMAANRLALIRLLTRVGPPALAAARNRIQHPEWYVVRNACKLLQELRDPDLFEHLAPAFQHQDQRVQSAALQAVKESRMTGSAGALAGALPFLSRALQEEALIELAFHKDKCVLPGLLAFLKSTPAPGDGTLAIVMQIISAVPGDESADILAAVAANVEFSSNVRAAALHSLSRKTSEHAQLLARNVGNQMPPEKPIQDNAAKARA
ncbi:MAG TPA: HEAT repeat domain-containing protein [Candidatus Saccharimonadales bacterium]|nr:HEAT repeat domain-containing protein [Candidatus Saccharimonadales bacterium]